MISRIEPLLALVCVLASAVVVGAVLTHDRSDAPSLDVALATGDAVAPAPGEELAVPTPTAAEPMSVSVSVGTSVTVAGRVLDAATRDAVVAAVEEALPGAEVVDQLSVLDDLLVEGARATIAGALPDAPAGAALAAALSALGFEVVSQYTVGGVAGSVAVVLDTDPRLGRFRDLLARADLLDRLAGDGPLTLFAPTDEALASLGVALTARVEDPARLVELLEGHVVEGEVFGADLAVPQQLTALNGDVISLSGDRTVGGAGLVEADVLAANGVVHVVDALVLTGAARTEAALNELVLTQPVQFSPGSATLLTESQVVLDAVAEILVAAPAGSIEVRGHTDSDGDANDNLSLSQARAEAVVVYLTARGVDPDRLSAVGLGETEPAVEPEITPEDKAANRRIEFRVTTTPTR